MKDFVKVIVMTLIGLAVAVLLYPFLHETGHAVATLIVGGKCVEFNLFPLPNVLCNVSEVSNPSLVFIGLSGLGMPFIFSVVIHSKNFYCWYTEMLLKGITLLSLVISITIILLSRFQIIVPYDDITTVLHIWKNGALPIAFSMIAAVVWLVVLIIQEKPIKRVIRELC